MHNKYIMIIEDNVGRSDRYEWSVLHFDWIVWVFLSK